MRDTERDEVLYLQEFAKLAPVVIGRRDWRGVERLLRTVWAGNRRRLAVEAAVEVVRGYFVGSG